MGAIIGLREQVLEGREILVSHDGELPRALCTLKQMSLRARYVPCLQIRRTLARGRAPLAVVLAPPAHEPPDLETVRAVREHAPDVLVVVCAYLRQARSANALRVLGAEVVFRPDYLPWLLVLLSRALQRRGDAVQRATLACAIIRRRYRLSPRETQLLELVTIGVSRKSLAAQLGVSENTTKTLIRRILLKVHEQSIEAVVRTALEEALEHASAELAEEDAPNTPPASQAMRVLR